MSKRAIANSHQAMRAHRPHLRCGLCDEPIEAGSLTCYVDDERCHIACARRYRNGHYEED